MTWGDLLKQITSLHLQFLEHFPLDYTESVKLERRILPFPEPQHIDQNYRWNLISEDPRILFHPLERALLEGPISPNETFRFRSPAHCKLFFETLCVCDQEWAKLIGAPQEGEIWLSEAWKSLASKSQEYL